VLKTQKFGFVWSALLAIFYTSGMATQQQVADHIGLSIQQIGNLIRSGILPSSKGRGGMDIDMCRMSYIQYLRGIKKGHIQDPEENKIDLDVQKERALNLRADTALKQLKEAQLRKELAPVNLLEWALAKTCSQIAATLDSIPVKVKRRVPKLTNAEIEIIRREIIKCQNAAAEATLDLDEYEAPNTLADRAV
jgi:phage terminase Nu1 subunit (DNA packaging protein)